MGPRHHHRTTRSHFVGEDSAGTWGRIIASVVMIACAAGPATAADTAYTSVNTTQLQACSEDAEMRLDDPQMLWYWEIALKTDIDGDGWIGPPPPPPPPPGGGGGVA